MCDPSNITGTRSLLTPEERLSKLIERDLLIKLNPHELRMFIKLHWSKISALSHAIHDEE